MMSTNEYTRVVLVSLAYCFLGDENGFELTILIEQEKSIGMCMAATVPIKWASGALATDNIFALIDERGCAHTEVIVKTDQEAKIECLIKDVLEASQRGAEEFG